MRRKWSQSTLRRRGCSSSVKPSTLGSQAVLGFTETLPLQVKHQASLNGVQGLALEIEGQFYQLGSSLLGPYQTLKAVGCLHNESLCCGALLWGYEINTHLAEWS